MGVEGVDPLLLNAWLTARSMARGLPAPVPDRGGFRVDTGSEVEIVRWVFPRMAPGLRALARSIGEPRHFLKLCGTADALRAVLPAGWTLHAESYFMRADGDFAGGRLADGYRIAVDRVGMAVRARIFSEDGALAASGYAAETRGAFIYDRIVTDPGHRRKGLGRALMGALRSARQHPDAVELLVATEDGRALYSTLGWVTISPYSTASIVAAS